MVLCYNKELFKLGKKELRKMHIFGRKKRIKKMFYFEIEKKIENKNFNGCFSLVLYII